MAKVETITFAQVENGAQDPQAPENFTSISGIYGQKIEPLFPNAKDNVNFSPAELAKAEQAYFAQQDLRFFRID